MLPPEKFNHYPNAIVKIYEDLESFVLWDISRRIATTGNQELRPTAGYQIEALKEMGIPMELIKKRIAAANALALEKVEEIIEEANIESFEQEEDSFRLAGKRLAFSPAKLKILETAIDEIKKKMLNMTGSLGLIGMPLEQAYQHALNTAFLEITTGANNYISAIKRQIKQLTQMGLEVIQYPSGRRDHLDVAIRRAVLTGIKNTTNKISEMNAREMGCDGYEISAHGGARPDHEKWQGRQFAIYTATSQYPLYADEVGDQMEDPNCRHSKWGIFLGAHEPVHSEKDLVKLESKSFTFSLNGKEYDTYTASQKQRSIERAIRKTKREIIGYSAAELKDQETAARAKLRQQYQLYSQFSKEAGLLEQRERLGVDTPPWYKPLNSDQ